MVGSSRISTFGAGKVIVIAGDEMEKGIVKVRDMSNSTESEIARGEVVAAILEMNK